MFDPALVALTSTPSIAASSVELRRPVSATTGACAKTAEGTASGSATAKIKATPVGSGQCMVPPRHFFYFCQHRLTRQRAASPPSTDSIAMRAERTSSCRSNPRKQSRFDHGLAGRTLSPTSLGNASPPRILPPSPRAQAAGWTFATAIAPVVLRAALAEITGVGVLADQ